MIDKFGLLVVIASFQPFQFPLCATPSQCLSISLLQNPGKMKKAQAEVDLVLGMGRPTFESLKKLQ